MQGRWPGVRRRVGMIGSRGMVLWGRLPRRELLLLLLLLLLLMLLLMLLLLLHPRLLLLLRVLLITRLHPRRNVIHLRCDLLLRLIGEQVSHYRRLRVERANHCSRYASVILAALTAREIAY